MPYLAKQARLLHTGVQEVFLFPLLFFSAAFMPCRLIAGEAVALIFFLADSFSTQEAFFVFCIGRRREGAG